MSLIISKQKIAKEILEENPKTCGDRGNGHFLNDVCSKLYPLGVDFTEFNTECWTRTRRRVLEKNPHLDTRTVKTKEVEEQIKKEVRC